MHKLSKKTTTTTTTTTEEERGGGGGGGPRTKGIGRPRERSRDEGGRKKGWGEGGLIRSFARGKAIHCVETQLTLLKARELRKMHFSKKNLL